MNIHFPIAALLAQQENTSSTAPAEGQSGASFADLLGLATQTDEQTMAALTGDHVLAALPRDGELPGLSFAQILSLPLEVTEEIHPELPAAELAGAESPEAEMTELPIDQPALQDTAGVASVANVQAASVTESAATNGEPLAAVQRVAAEQPLQQTLAQNQAGGNAKTQPAEAGFNVKPEQLDVAGKPAPQSAMESATLMTANTVQTAPASAPGRGLVNAPMSSPQWQSDLSQQVSSFVLRGDSRVSLQLNPAELGPLLVELKMVEQSAQLQFLSGQAAVRSAVEQAMPQLRDALAQQGIDLGDVNVGEQSAEREQAQSAPSGIATNTAEAQADEAELAQVEVEQNSPALPGQLSVYA